MLFRKLARDLATGLRVAGRLATYADPWLRLVIRLWVAQAFLVLQIAMMMTAQSPVVRIGGAAVAHLAQTFVSGSAGGVVQALCPLLLAAGLMTRPAAAAMFLQALVLRYDGTHAMPYAFWALLLLILILRGPGALSLDRLLGPGLANAAVPGPARVAAFYARLSATMTPPLLALLRLLVAAVVLSPHAVAPTLVRDMPTAMHAVAAGLDALDAMLPHRPTGIAVVPPLVRVLLATPLVLGLGVRPISLALLFLVPIGAASFSSESFYWALLLGALVVGGGGAAALDRALSAAIEALSPAVGSDAPHIIIVGGGFGGTAVARGLADAPCRVTVIDRQNYNLFQPLLYQVATAGLSPADIAVPIRAMLRDQLNTRVLLGTVDGVDHQARTVHIGASKLRYDALVLATGAQHSYFGRDEWSAVAPGLKGLEDATDIRRRLLAAFEHAEATDDLDERHAWLTFIVVGGGPTGVELAGAIAELARFGLARDFRAFDPASARVILVQAAPRLLPAFNEASSAEALAALRRLGVEVLLDERAEAISAEGITTKAGFIVARSVFWAAGVEASPAARWLKAPADRAGRTLVGADLRVAGCGEVFAIGDTCASQAWDGKPVPGLAPAAKQAGAYVARVIDARLRGAPAPPPFRYRHAGNLATIGRKAAVAEFGTLRVKGALAWWLWGLVHVLFLISGRNRVGVIVEWLWDYLTLRRGTRLIIGERIGSRLDAMG